MLEHHVDGIQAWSRETIKEEDWRLGVPSDCLLELQEVVQKLELEPMPMLALACEDYSLKACSELMRKARNRLDHGAGVVLLDRLPVETWRETQARKVFWLLGTLLGRTVSQSIHGEMMVSVRDTGVPKQVGVRGFRTNYPQRPHTDNSFNQSPPDHVSLLCLNKANAGGVSQFISFYTVHNVLRDKHPELLARLYEPFYQDRQGDFRPGESQTVFYPVFAYDTELRSRYTHFTIPAGYQTEGLAFEGITRAAFEAITDVVDDQSLYCEFTIEPGELQIVNNRSFGHGRGRYVDGPNLSDRRHLLRLWHRNFGRRAYSG